MAASDLVLVAGNFGLGAVFAFIVLRMYAKQSGQFIEVIKETVTAVVGLQTAVTTLQSAVDALREDLRRR